MVENIRKRQTIHSLQGVGEGKRQQSPNKLSLLVPVCLSVPVSDFVLELWMPGLKGQV